MQVKNIRREARSGSNPGSALRRKILDCDPRALKFQNIHTAA
jgi:hypothetical protein